MPYIKCMGGTPPTNTLHTFQMRKIERQMNTAIQRAINWSSANTRVEAVVGASRIYLHGNLIAEVGDDYMQIFDGGWQTTTTKSRLNALFSEFCNPGEGVFQKAYQWFVRVNGEIVPFESGMILR